MTMKIFQKNRLQWLPNIIDITLNPIIVFDTVREVMSNCTQDHKRPDSCEDPPFQASSYEFVSKHSGTLRHVREMHLPFKSSSCQPVTVRKKKRKTQEQHGRIHKTSTSQGANAGRKPRSLSVSFMMILQWKVLPHQRYKDTWWITSRNLLLFPNCWTVIPQRPREYSPWQIYSADSEAKLQHSPDGPHPDGSLNYIEYGNVSRMALMDSGYIYISDGDEWLIKGLPVL